MTIDSASQKALQDQFANRVYEGYKNRSQEFNKTFGILLVFAAVFMLLVQLPYTLIKSRQVGLDSRLQELTSQSQQLDQKAKLYAQVLQGINELRTAMNSGPDRLRSQIRDLAQLRQRLLAQDNIGGFPAQQQLQTQQRQQQQMPEQRRCGDVRSEQWLSCEVQAALNEQFAQFQAILNQGILASLQNLAESGESIDTQSVRGGMEELQGEFWNTLRQNSEFWLTFSGKVDFFSQLDHLVERFWSTHGANIEKKAQALQAELDKLKTERTVIQEQKNRLLKTADSVEKRLSSIESPFGKLPVGMAESIALFPLIIAIGFALAAAKLNSAMALRHEIFRIWRGQDPQRQLLSDAQIDLIAPLTTAPAPEGRITPGKISLLFLPLLIYVVACVLISYTWIWTMAVNEEEILQGLKPIYTLLYAASAVIMAVSYGKILKNMRLRSKE